MIAAETLLVVDAPAFTVPDDGAADREKSFGGGGVMSPVNSSLFGEPGPGLITLPLVASATSLSRTCCGVNVGLPDSTRAAAPTTCGVAIEVPLMVLVAVSLAFHDEVMFTPGAKMSTQVPKLAKLALLSLMSVALTVIAAGTRAGEVVQASCGLPKMSPLPAAMP